MTITEALGAVRALLSVDEDTVFAPRPTRWVKRTSAQDAAGVSVVVTSPNAYAFCLAGGVERIARMEFGDDQDWDSPELDALMESLSDAINAADFQGRVPRVEDGEDPYGYLDPGIRVVRFNDHPETNADDVFAVIDKAIEMATA